MSDLPDLVLSVDPGKLTGIALVESAGPTVLASSEVEILDLEAALMALLEQAGLDRGLLPVIEKFTITIDTAKNSQAPWSLEAIGITRNTVWRERSQELVMQLPSEAKNLMTNPRLRALGCWHRGGEGHANDAIRHALYALHRRGWRDRRLLLG